MINRLLYAGMLRTLLFTSPLLAQLSPGPLAQAHEHLSGLTNCLTCHTWGSKDLTPKCLDCHTPIKARLELKQGFHGLMDDPECQTCHTDHVKREFNMIHWEPSQADFDHFETGYELKGKHGDLSCENCHTPELILAEDVIAYAISQKSSEVLNKTFLGLGTNCENCHADVHRAEFKDQTCQDCHNEENWLDVRTSFDHDLRTEFTLRGAHDMLECEKCHSVKQESVGEFQVPRFSGLKYELCTDCHEDEHKGSFGNNCLKCHTERSFKIADQTGAFNHTATGYPLIGKHLQVECETCHTSEGRFTDSASYDECIDCHQDYHKGVFNQSNRDKSCDACHSMRGFIPALFGVMEHAKTKFPIDGAHLAQPCVFCHVKNDKAIYRWEPLNCEACHTTTHGTQFARYRLNNLWCESCHLTSAWESLVFDHNTTFFPLSGKHNEIKCEACHTTESNIVQYEDTDTSCLSCHTDVHSNQFPEKDCDACHTSRSWKIEPFNHLLNTDFPLDGQHNDLSCGQCHKFDADLKTIRFKPLAHACQDCHSFGDFKR